MMAPCFKMRGDAVLKLHMPITRQSEAAESCKRMHGGGLETDRNMNMDFTEVDACCSPFLR